MLFSHLKAEMFGKNIYIWIMKHWLDFVKMSLLQYNYTFEYWVIWINYMYLLYGKGLA